jgi:PiT family inorganic phosphate transporter
VELILAIVLALAFSMTNGFHDASNAIATLVATRGARPGQAITISAVFNMIGAIVVGTAVADTIAGIVTVAPDEVVAVIGAGSRRRDGWNLATWRRPPSSPGTRSWAASWAQPRRGRPRRGELGRPRERVAPRRGLRHPHRARCLPRVRPAVGILLLRILAVSLRRATRRVSAPVRGAGWTMAAGLSFSHGANDAQKSMGIIAALLLAEGMTSTLTVPLWVKVATGVTLTLGTALGGWRIVRTVGRRIFPLRPLDSVASQSASTAVIMGASLVGAPVSTTQVVASRSWAWAAGGTAGIVRWEIVRDSGVVDHYSASLLARRSRRLEVVRDMAVVLCAPDVPMRTQMDIGGGRRWHAGRAATRTEAVRDTAPTSEVALCRLRTVFVTRSTRDLFEISVGLDGNLNNAKTRSRGRGRPTPDADARTQPSSRGRRPPGMRPASRRRRRATATPAREVSGVSSACTGRRPPRSSS